MLLTRKVEMISTICCSHSGKENRFVWILMDIQVVMLELASHLHLNQIQLEDLLMNLIHHLYVAIKC